MTGPAIVPCLWFDGQAAEAAASWTRILPGSRVTAKGPRTVDFELAGRPFTALDGGPAFHVGPAISFFLHADEPRSAAALFDALAEGGTPFMPFGEYPWSPGYGWIQDRFGVSWQVFSGPRPSGTQVVVPCLMFSGERFGRAAEAMEAWGRTFPASRVSSVDRYTREEGFEGAVKHARFELAGQEFVAMDAPGEHAFGFDEGVSLQVRCTGAGEADRIGRELAEGGAPSRHGWVRDRFGVWWQVVPPGPRMWDPPPP